MLTKILTFNIWFSDHAMARRMRAIGDLIAQHAPHVIALQEVTTEHLALLSEHPSWRAYDWTAPPDDASYYTMLGSLRSWSALGHARRRTYTHTSMDRDLLSAVVQPAGQPPLVIGTTHLESLTMVRARCEQIAEATGWLTESTIEDVVLCGDTNLATGSLKGRAVEERVSLPDGWSDAWEACGTGEGFTFDVDANAMVTRLDGWARVNKARLRYDRSWTRLAHYQCVGLEMVGTAPLPSDGDGDADEWWPSDHFGLLTRLAVGSETEPAPPAKVCAAS